MQCHGWAQFFGCFYLRSEQVGGMSLNPFEQVVFDYLKGHADERQYWQDKVRHIVSDSVAIPAAVSRLDGEFWRYFEERSGVVPAFNEMRQTPGLRRVSMMNLAELLVRLWTEPRPKPAADGGIPAD
jgi:hypothetical protein